MEELDEVMLLVEFYEDVKSIEKEYPNDMEFGSKARKLLSDYQKTLSEE